jgi:hypothetical protein
LRVLKKLEPPRVFDFDSPFKSGTGSSLILKYLTNRIQWLSTKSNTHPTLISRLNNPFRDFEQGKA